MKRFPRLMLNAATVLSLLLCTAVIVLWVRSYSVADIVWHRQYWNTVSGPHWHAHWTYRRFASHRGKFVAISSGSISGYGVVDSERPIEAPPDPEWEWTHFPEHIVTYNETICQRIGLFVARHEPKGQIGVFEHYAAIGTPYWLPTILLATLPASRLVRRRHRKRAARLGLCPRCGYDLRATPEQCPECGAVPKRPPGSSG